MHNLYVIDSVETFDDAIASYEDTDKFQFVSDIEFDKQYTFKSSVILCIDLDGHTITLNPDRCFYFPKGCDVEITNGSIVANGDDAITLLGTEAYPCNVKIGEDVSIEGSSSIIYVQKQSKVTLDGCNIVSTSEDKPVVTVKGKNADLHIKDSKISASSCSTLVDVSEKGRICIDRGADIFCDSTTNSSKGCVRITGEGTTGFITCDGKIESTGSCLVLDNKSEFTIEDGSLITNSSLTTIKVSGGSILRVVGGDIVNNKAGGNCIVISSDGESISKLDVTGGNFKSDSYCIKNSGDEVISDIKISGATFDGGLDPLFIPEGKQIVDGKLVDIKLSVNVYVEFRNTPIEKMPHTVIIDLVRNGLILDEVTFAEASEWAYTFEDLDRVDIEGEKYSYELSVHPIDNFVVDIDDIIDCSLNEYLQNVIVKLRHEEPEPEPEPTPEPEPEPEPQPTPEKIVEPGKSYRLRKFIWIYRTPSHKIPTTEFLGVLHVTDVGWYEKQSNIEYASVKFKLPGNGRYDVGYVERRKLERSI